MLLGVGAKQKFEGVLRPDGTGLMWTVITVPFDPKEVVAATKGAAGAGHDPRRPCC
jgi:hypothetical protein